MEGVAKIFFDQGVDVWMLSQSPFKLFNQTGIEYTITATNEPTFGLVIVCSVLLILCCLLWSIFYICVSDDKYVVMECWGNYTRTLEGGIHYSSLFEYRKGLHWTKGKGFSRFHFYGFYIPKDPQTFDIEDYTFVTKEQANVCTNTALTYQIVDPHAAVYQTNNLWRSMEKEMRRAIREVIENNKNDVVAKDSVARMNESVRGLIRDNFTKWGVKIVSFEFKYIEYIRTFDENNDTEFNEGTLQEHEEAGV